MHSALSLSDFIDLFQEYQVDLVLVGHHHSYRRSWPLFDDEPNREDGVIYIQLGGGGGNLSKNPSPADIRWAKTYHGYGYSMFWVYGDHLSCAMYDVEGSMRDSFVLAKNGSRQARMAPFMK